MKFPPLSCGAALTRSISAVPPTISIIRRNHALTRRTAQSQDLVYLLTALFALASVLGGDVDLLYGSLLYSQLAFGSGILAYASLFQPIFHVSQSHALATALE